jgi:sec-independent protein translocase protein TatA
MPMPGPAELVIILVIALLVLGPGKLPDVGSALGKSIREFRKATSEVEDSVRVTPAQRSQQSAPAEPAAPPPPAQTPPSDSTPQPQS